MTANETIAPFSACLASILPYTNAEWEKLWIFLNFLLPKLPALGCRKVVGEILELQKAVTPRA